MSSLKNKVVIVTGGSSGIGKSICLDLAKLGAKVAVADINISDAENTIALLKEQYPGTAAIAVKCDVGKSSDVEYLVSETVKQLGLLYGAVNCAGIGGLMYKIGDYPEDEFDKLLQVNIKGVFLCMKHEVNQFSKQGTGQYAIVNISSFSGLRGHRLNAPYAATKHAVLGLTKSAALEYARAGVRINAICPTFVLTPMFRKFAAENSAHEAQLKRSVPLGRICTPEEVSAATIWLLGTESSFTTGHALTVDGGISCL